MKIDMEINSQIKEKILIAKKRIKTTTDYSELEKIFNEFSNAVTKIASKKIQKIQDEKKELIEREKAVSQIINGSMIPTFVINQNHIVTHWNRACEKLTGCDAKDIIGTDKHWTPFRLKKRPTMADVIVASMGENDINKYYMDLWNKSAIIEGAYEAEEFFPHLGENGKWFFFTAAPIKSRKGKIIGAIETLWDKTEIKKIEQEKERAVSGMAHYIKNILVGLKGGSYVLDVGFKNNNTEKMKKGWNTIKKNISRISDLAQDLLTCSKLKEPEYQKCLPNEIINDVVDLVKDIAKEKEIKIKTILDLTINKVFMDPTTIHRSLLNLISNAIDACLDDKDTDKDWFVSIETSNENNKFVCIKVKDNGCGMTQKAKDNLYTSFFSTKGSKGTGLGLFVTSKLIKEHNGTIDFTSKLGKGTTFIIRLPLICTKE